MKKIIKKLGVFNSIAVALMAAGLILWLLTPLMLWLWNFDSDIIGLMVFMMGVALLVVGIIVRAFIKKR